MRRNKVRESTLLGGMKRRTLDSALAACFIAVGSINAYALNIGDVRVQSHIGENLSVFVPVSDGGQPVDIANLIVSSASIEQKKSLGITDFGGRTPEINYQTIGNGGRQGVLITSNAPINEPYVNLAFQVNYNGSIRLKAVPILLDLPGLRPEPATFPYATGSADQRNQNSVTTSDSTSTLSGANNTNFVSSSISASGQSDGETITSSAQYTSGGAIMGPYDWAQEGLIPESFGPVLDGQSLWRVARRINKAMGVSVDQMMWGLYRANPSAFASKSVASLRSGVTLKIPSESLVREKSELEALRLLAENTGSSGAAPDTVVSDSSNELSEESSSSGVADNSAPVSGVSENSTFVETNVESNFKITKPENISKFDAELITTLQANVDVMMDQLVQKNLEIDFLRNIIISEGIEIPEFDSNSITAVGADAGTEMPIKGIVPKEMADAVDTVDVDIVVPDQNNEALVEPDFLELDNSIVNDLEAGESAETSPLVDINATPPVNIIESELEPEPAHAASSDNASSDNDNTATGIWPWLLGGLAVLLGALYLLRNIFSGLFHRFFGKDDEIVLNIPSVLDSRSTSATSAINAVPKDVEHESIDKDLHLDDDDFLLGDGHVDIEEVNLSDRIKQLLKSGDFAAARKTVEFAEEASIDANYLDFCRLKIAAAEQDKSEFAKVFNKVNRRINDFPPDIQHRIAELHREMFDSETMIDFGFKED